ncbi:MAG: hypothetical protein ACYS5V_10405, partial [Planctomycetota bacterium]
FDLSDFRRYRKVMAACAFPLDSTVAGGFPMTIGDVGAPAKGRMPPAVGGFELNFRLGWRLTGDPRFAWICRHRLGRGGESDEQWAAIEAAAARQGRDPFLAGRSRVLTDWAGILEAGVDEDDFRRKRAVYVRVGTGHGHAHADTLDLQVVAHGCRMANDVGWRGAYAMPTPGRTRVHNRVEVNGQNHPREGDWQGHAWIDTHKPLPGARYLHATAVPPSRHRNAKFFTRAVALIDADDGPNSYVFDVQRIGGGACPTFNFHGCWSDAFEVNLTGRRSVGQATHEQTARDTSAEAMYLRKFLDAPGRKFAGDVPADGKVVATWRLRRAQEVIEGTRPHTGAKVSRGQINAEKRMLADAYDPGAPRKFTRLHLLGRRGERILSGHLTPTGPAGASASWPFLMVQRDDATADRGAVYPAVIEPYAGKPFLGGVRLLEAGGDAADALRPVAMEVRTAGGRTDVCIDNPRGGPLRVGDLTVAGRFAYVSRDADGLRMAHLVEGDRLDAGDVRLWPARPRWRARIASVDYFARRVALDGAHPDVRWAGQQVEIGNAQHKTSYTVTAATTTAGRTVLTVDKAIDLSYARVRGVDAEKRIVRVNLQPPAMAGRDAGLTCTTADMSRAWKCRLRGRRGGGYAYELTGAVTPTDFPRGSVLRLWEFGAGDEVRLASHCHLARAGGADEYDLRADTDATVAFRDARRIQRRGSDGRWRDVPASAEAGWLTAALRAAETPGGAVRLRVNR